MANQNNYRTDQSFYEGEWINMVEILYSKFAVILILTYCTVLSPYFKLLFSDRPNNIRYSKSMTSFVIIVIEF